MKFNTNILFFWVDFIFLFRLKQLKDRYQFNLYRYFDLYIIFIAIGTFISYSVGLIISAKNFVYFFCIVLIGKEFIEKV